MSHPRPDPPRLAEAIAQHLSRIMDAEDQNQGCEHPSVDIRGVMFCCQWNDRSGDKMCAECRRLQLDVEHAARALVATVTSDLLSDLRTLEAQWRGMIELAEARGPIAGDEIGHAARWETLRMAADDLAALLARLEGQ
jgi:hypothetical protein